jgi:nucleotide-binding universal stress UspA family protein
VSRTTAITIEAIRQTISTAIITIQLRGMGTARILWPADLERGKGVWMFERILVGTDGSGTADEAVRQAVELARATGAKLEIVSAYEPVRQSQLREEAGEIPADLAYAVGPRENVNGILEAAVGEAERAGVETRSYAREGDPADAILDVAEETKADVIVIGNKGMTGARRFLLGSVPNKISHHAPCSVYIVRTT